MKRIVFNKYTCGLSDKTFSDKIMIWEPLGCYEVRFYVGKEVELSDSISDVVEKFRDVAECDDQLGNWEKENLRYDTIYIKTEDVLLGLREDKTLSEIFEYFNSEELELIFFCVGGASFNYEGYKFTVRTDEDRHKNTPHVHVSRAGNDTRYYLESLERNPNDNFSREFRRDERRLIIPYLKKNQKKLMNYWDHYMNGFELPTEDEYGRQYYKES